MIILNIFLAFIGGNFTTIVVVLVIIAIIVAVKSGGQEDFAPVEDWQNNKVINITLKGGLLGMMADSPQRSLNNRIKKENANGWRVVQIIPADSGNVFLSIFRIVLLVITFFLFTTANGYYVILERNSTIKPSVNQGSSQNTLKCEKCKKPVKSEDTFCENCGNKLT